MSAGRGGPAPSRQSRNEVRPVTEAGPGRSEPARTLIVDVEHAGRRLDKFLRSRVKGVPAGLLFRLLRQGKLRVNGRKAQQNYRLQAGDEITVPALRIDADAAPPPAVQPALIQQLRGTALHERSEERRVGTEGSSRGSTDTEGEGQMH